MIAVLTRFDALADSVVTWLVVESLKTMCGVSLVPRSASNVKEVSGLAG